MPAFVVSGLQRVRNVGGRFFRHFGIHCATHQIRVIIISCLVITSLFYPALSIYSSSQPQLIAHYSSRIRDTLHFLEGFGYPAHDDLHDIWTRHNALHVREDPIARALCATERTLRVERILAYSPELENDNALNPHTILATMELETAISKILSTRRAKCLTKPGGECLVISPSMFWSGDEQVLQSQANVFGSVNLSKNVSASGIPVTPHMVLAGRRLNEHFTSQVDFASALALTFIFVETDCLDDSGHISWRKVLEDATAGNAQLVFETQEPNIVTLELDTKTSHRRGSFVISAFICMAYLIFLGYFVVSMRRMNTVHSRIGLAFTGLVELLVSTITSLSVCALVGFKITMVPWAFLLIVILFVGAENMFALVDAVVKTSITLSVKDRIGEGLSRAGTSNTLKVVTYNSILGVIAFFSVGAIRQFCTFAIVVLVAHWFLVHTFFTTVLSIDIQRLELDELLRQDSSLAPSAGTPRPPVSNPPSNQPWRRSIMAANNLLHGRATKNLSLLLLLAVTATLYYATSPPTSALNREEPRFPFTPSSSAKPKHIPIGVDPAEDIWKTLNPVSNDPVIHLRIESPTIVAFTSSGGADATVDLLPNRSRLTMKTIEAFTWLLKIVVFPISVTTGTLYGLLLYLLKDAELLEAQRNRAGPDAPPKEEDAVEPQISFTTLPRAFPTDVELIAASKDGRFAASIGLGNELVVWRTDTKDCIQIDATDVLTYGASTSSATSALTALALDEYGQFCAVGTGAGVIAIWSINETSAIPFQHHLSSESLSSTVTDIEFLQVVSSPTTRLSTARSPASPPPLVSVYDNGAAVKWTTVPVPVATPINSSRPPFVDRSMLLRFEGDETPLIAFSMEDGLLEISEIGLREGGLGPDCQFLVGNPIDRAVKVHGRYLDFGGERHLIIAVGTRAGVVSLWDAKLGDCISVLDEGWGEVTGLRISPIRRKACSICGEYPPESFSVAISVHSRIIFHRVYASVQGRQCSCPRCQPHQSPVRNVGLGRRSRSSSQAPSPGSASPVIARSRLPSVSDGAVANIALSFPVSGHGVHSRRISEKDALRRGSDNLSVTIDGEEDGFPSLVGPDTTLPSMAARSALWQSAVIVRSAEATLDRGGWDVFNGRFVGVRRKPRTIGKPKERLSVPVDSRHLPGLSIATLERWELWTFDPQSSSLRASSLVTLHQRQPVITEDPHRRRSASSGNKGLNVPGIPFTRVSSVVGGRTFCLSGFGNTLGLFSLELP
ncbi:hypothetical protein JAAARDRAFT_33205 [Jaapia argillacea MUCL 33604]|uniref:Sterol regulatory element-binding protein cleavage-activating protein n=1 Tax=Jaapia argillacea MUCL 33604 TaxID=933084 RepID=A0A067PXS1_9AGAM|nr:hypothetical protein JAAARDRAFT_33205 [Jaapia argillacea MUCL 33604]